MAAPLWPTPQYGTADDSLGGNDPRAYSNKPFGASDPTRGVADKAFPWGGVARTFTHESVYTNPRELLTRIMLATFKCPDALFHLVLPLFPHDEETISWTEFSSKLRSFPQHSHQGPHQTFFMSQTRMKFDMNWHGLMFSLDNSILQTPADSFLTSAHCHALQQNMQFTIFEEVIGSIINQDDMISREFQYQTKHRANIVSDATAMQRVLDLMEILPGIFDKGDTLDSAVGYFMEHAANHLACFKAQPDLVPNFFIMSSGLAASLKTKNAAVNSQLSEQHITEYFRNITGNNELMYYMDPSDIRQFRGLNIIDIAPVDTNEGRRDHLSRPWVEGLAHIIDTHNMARYDAINFETRSYAKIFEHGFAENIGGDANAYVGSLSLNPAGVTNAITSNHAIAQGVDRAFPVKFRSACWVHTHAFPVAEVLVKCRYIVAFRPSIQNSMHMVVEGIGGRATGLTAIGRQPSYNYDVPQNGKRSWVAEMRIGVCVGHPEHFAILPHAKHQQYISGGTTDLAELQHTAGMDPPWLPDPYTTVYRHGGNSNKGCLVFIRPGVYNHRLPKIRASRDTTTKQAHVFMYWVDPGCNDSITGARLLSCSGVWADDRMNQLASTNDGKNPYNWLIPEAAVRDDVLARLTLKSANPCRQIEREGLAPNAPNVKCWVTKGRYWKFDPVTGQKTGDPIYTSRGHGPWRDYGTDAMDIFQNLPRARHDLRSNKHDAVDMIDL